VSDVIVKDGTEYDVELTKDDVPTKVKIGGTTAKFVPNINCQKWDDEAWLNINHPDVVATEKETFVDNKVSIEVGNNIHRYYVDAKGQIEYEIVLKTKPLSNKIELTLDFPDGLFFAYQDTLENDFQNGIMVEPGETLAEYLTHTFRPPEVVGSYAVYWQKRNNKYRTGKFCHIYRPTATDDVLDEIFCDITIVGKTLTIEIPQAWLDSAVFPVVIDPTLGYTTIGGTTGGTNNRNYVNKGGSIVDDTASVTGTVTDFHFYQQANWTAGETIYIGLYNESGGDPGTIVAQTTMTSVAGAGWKTVSGLSWAVTSGSDYYTALNSSFYPISGPLIYDTGLGGTCGIFYISAAGPLPEPWNAGGDSWSGGILISYYVDYSGAAGANAPTGHLYGSLVGAMGGPI
jgi:hypothetical protein